MFTIDQIKAAHSKVKSGADFPKYVQELKTLGVTRYVQHVSDGHTEYLGNDSPTTSSARYDLKEIASIADKKGLEKALEIHQAGDTDYLTFCTHAAGCGVNAWKVDTTALTCTYYDLEGNQILVETIPG